MRNNILGLAALAAGGILLARQATRRYHHPVLDHPGSHSMLDRSALNDEFHGVSLGTALAAAAAIAGGGMLLARQMRSDSESDYDSDPYADSSNVVEWIELNVPVSTAYNQWTQFEEFPKFMATVEEVKQMDDTHLRWCAIVAGKRKEWIAEITEQVPDQRIAWRSTGGVHNAGVVTFHRISDARCRIVLQMEYTPQTLTEKLGDAVGGVKMTAKGNLKKFKKLVESRGHESGAWRGTVQQQ